MDRMTRQFLKENATLLDKNKYTGVELYEFAGIKYACHPMKDETWLVIRRTEPEEE